MEILTFALHLHRMSILPKILMLCQRLGGEVTYVSAADGRANIVVATPKAAAHRYAPQIRRLIDVLELTELHAVGLADADAQSTPERLRHTA
ncbi:MAG: hypothetical protein DHS20C16_16360 [Phycisphaerae bacterium]|nr:MAG: hypothetical protein DHS20C16_16360 [Phycisphaerae bacterium]